MTKQPSYTFAEIMPIVSKVIEYVVNIMVGVLVFAFLGLGAMRYLRETGERVNIDYLSSRPLAFKEERKQTDAFVIYQRQKT